MILEIFEADGYTLPTDIDVLLINLKKKYAADLGIKKINITNKEEIRKHKDIVHLLAQQGLDALPLIKLDGKIVDHAKLEKMLYKRLG
ncbi:MAG: arsenic metallochaperone ArsD family protein [Candidatus Aenigmarchaeota archaeon]|nr:arsenic metallochaperone ArsD family protein [Candidatus Aenigmarchaeota archaeon]